MRCTTSSVIPAANEKTRIKRICFAVPDKGGGYILSLDSAELVAGRGIPMANENRPPPPGILIGHWYKLKPMSEIGAVLPLAAFMLPVLVLIAGFVVWLMSSGAAREQIRGGAGLVALSAVEQYFSTQCDPALSADACHNLKISAAVTRAQSIANSNQTQLGTIQISQNASISGTSGGVYLEARNYYAVKPPQTDPCSPYPCSVARPAGQLANAIRLTGSVSNTLALRLSRALGLSFGGSGVTFDLTTTAVPIHVAYVIDISGSIAESTHLPIDMASSQATGEVGVGEATAGDTALGGANGTVGGGDDDGDIPPAPTEVINHASFFAFPTVEDKGSYVVMPEISDIWNALGNPPTPRDSDPKNHYQPDYQDIESLLSDNSGYNSVAQSVRDRHPAPGEGGIILDGNLSPPPNHFKLDTYRKSGTYEGAEPYVSVLKGVKQALQLLADRRVAGDEASLIFYDSTVAWNRVFKLTDDLDYLKSVLDIDSIKDGTILEANVKAYQLSGDPSLLGQIIWNRLFPSGMTYTNTLLAFAEAERQLSTDGGTHPTGEGTIPSVDAIVHVSDGLLNCTLAKDCDAQSHLVYKQAMTEMKAFAANHLFPEKVAMHMLMVGSQGGQHTLRIDKKVNGVSVCQDDEDARKTGTDFVLGQSFSNENQAQIAWDNRFFSPFYQASKDWYDITVMTGGVWAPIRRVQSGCVPSNDNCAGPTNPPQRIETDPQCRDVEAQVEDSLEHIFKNSHAFVVVK